MRSRGEGYDKVHYTEIIDTKTGESVGFMGRGCVVVRRPEEAETHDRYNKLNAEWGLSWCKDSWDKDDRKVFKDSLKKAMKKA